MNKKLKPFINVCDAIGKLFYPNVEVVLHDINEKKLVYLVNAFSNRKIGDAMINDVQDISSIKDDIVGPYEKIGVNDKRIKSVSTILRDENNIALAVMCLNFDIELFDSIYENIKNFLNIEKKDSPHALFSQDWKSHTNSTINNFLNLKDKKLEELKTKEKKELVLYLNSEGIFTIRNIISYLCEVLKISRATIYKWLKENENR